MDLDHAHAVWTLGRFPWGGLPELAAQMMVQGFEGPAILELASFHKPASWDIPRELVLRAFQECGRHPLEPEDAARRACEHMLRSSSDPATLLPRMEELLRGHEWKDPVLDELRQVCEFWCWGEQEPDLRREAETRWPKLLRRILRA